jgi:hypothetical protein
MGCHSCSLSLSALEYRGISDLWRNVVYWAGGFVFFGGDTLPAARSRGKSQELYFGTGWRLRCERYSVDSTKILSKDFLPTILVHRPWIQVLHVLAWLAQLMRLIHIHYGSERALCSPSFNSRTQEWNTRCGFGFQPASMVAGKRDILARKLKLEVTTWRLIGSDSPTNI